MRPTHCVVIVFSLMLASCADSDPHLSSDPAVSGAASGHVAEGAHSTTHSGERPHSGQHAHDGEHRAHSSHDAHTNGVQTPDAHEVVEEAAVHGNSHAHDSEHSVTAEHSDATHGQAKAGDHAVTTGHVNEPGQANAAGAAADRPNDDADDLQNADAATIFARRIQPIFQSDAPSSCTECHFAGVELRDFILKDQAATFASLKAAGLINVDRPDDSKLLNFIGRKPDKPDALIAKVRQQELVAFRAWIKAAVREPELLKAVSTVAIGTELPPEVIRHARKDRVLSSFIANVWSEMGRCINCHSPERNRNKIGRNGFTKEDVDAISWIVPGDPAATLQELVDGGNIDTDDPSLSPVLTKPAGLSEHRGGPKFFPGSHTYRNFLAFLKDYANIINARYADRDDLPEPPSEVILPTKQQLRVVRIPATLSGLRMRVDFHRWNSEEKAWSAERWGTAFSQINEKNHAFQNSVAATAPVGSRLADEFRRLGRLPAGRYLAKFFIDRQKTTDKDPEHELTQSDFVGQVEFTGEWKPGYQPPKIITFPITDE